MTPEELNAKFLELHTQRLSIMQRIADAARPVIAVLLDAGRTNSAKELQELLFEFDAKSQEASEFLRANMKDMILNLLSRGQG